MDRKWILQMIDIILLLVSFIEQNNHIALIGVFINLQKKPHDNKCH